MVADLFPISLPNPYEARFKSVSECEELERRVERSKKIVVAAMLLTVLVTIAADIIAVTIFLSY